MGQKVDPRGFRVGIINDWNSKWYADKKHYGEYLVEDHKIREYIKKKLYVSGISKIEIERTSKFVKVNVYTAKPGLVIGKGGNLAESLKSEIEKMIGKHVNLNIVEVKDVDTNAQLVAENIASQLERRISFRRAMKQSMQKAMKMGAKGIKAACSGRLGGADMARTEFYKDGTVPLQTLRADIDYGFAEADTTYGKIGVKVWIYKGEILPEKKDKRVEGGDNHAINAKKD
ncbi:MAG: 30S ribosomal protein S3 [Clostridia bacterium]|nr:30S ribosomal protein S3 [Clostridia bacterium]